MKLTVVSRSNGTITNASASILRGQLGKKSTVKVVNGSAASDLAAALTDAGHTVTVVSYFDLKPAQQKSLFPRAHKARVKAGKRAAASA